MKISDYSKKALTTLTSDQEYGEITPQMMAQVLGLVGESGEVAEKVKKFLRDKKGRISEEDKKELIKELGDVLWYINSLAHLLGSSLEEVAVANNQKLANRAKENKIHGEGDNR